MKKRCTLCKAEKPLGEFARQRGRPDGHSCWCKLCHSAKSKAWREANPGKARAAQKKWRDANPGNHRQPHLRKTFGMEVEDYERLLAEQEGRCAICGRTESDAAKGYLCVDHIAGTLRIRGLLCAPCNSAIGLLGHDPARLTNAIAYLAREPALEGVRFPQGVHRSRLRSPA